MTQFITFLISVARSFLDALVVQSFWLWFVVPAAALRPIGYWNAMGLDWFVALFFVFLSSYHYADKETKAFKKDDAWAYALAKVISVLIIFGTGALLHWAMR
jgi:hypothetical protein